MPPVILQVLPRYRCYKKSNIVTLQEKVELFGMYQRLRSAAVVASHLKIHESSVRMIVKKKKEKGVCEAISGTLLIGIETLSFW